MAAVLFLYSFFSCAFSMLHNSALSNISPEHIKFSPEDITLTVSPTSLPSNGQWVNLTISGVPSPTSTDWIAVYSPAQVNITKTAPIKYMYCTKDPNYLKTGNGLLSFYLLNERADVVFVFYRNGTTYPVYTAQSNVIAFSNLNEPTQGHLALTGNPGEIKITWTTKDTDTPYVAWGIKSGEYLYKSSANTTTYTLTDMCGGAASSVGWREPGAFHSAIMNNLTPSITYYYRYGDSYGLSSEFSFVSPPIIDANTRFNFIIFGDMGQDEIDGSTDESWGQAPPSRNTSSALMNEMSDHHLVLHIGDISYAVGYECQWETFLDQIQPLATQASWMTCAGNHERDWPGTGDNFNNMSSDSGGECGKAYNKRFPMPGAQDWYSFDYGSAHFTIMDTELNYSIGSAQYQFIENDLAKVNRSLTPWIIFAGHRPMYVDSTNNNAITGDQPVATDLRTYIEPLLYKYQVDLAFWGHHHSYQRTCPVYQSSCKSSSNGAYSAPIHFVTGAGGAGNSQNLESTQPSWIKWINDNTHGYTRATVTPESIVLEYVIGGAGETQVLDSFDLLRPTDRK